MSRLLVDGFHVLIGIETHAQIKSRQKLFSAASTSSLAQLPNTAYNVFDAAFPGTLPRLNPKCLHLALRAAIALNCQVNPTSTFDRKHYFYSDLSSGYQITQHYSPFAANGHLALHTHGGRVRIRQVQIEQDTAKSTFNPRLRTNQIDLNRAGTGLLEIVTEPDITSPDQAAEYVRTLQSVLRAIGSSDGNMEAGSLRCDVNISINRPGEPPGTRCELKNLNSVRFMVAAINFEIQRQRAILASSNPVVPQETRAFDQDKWETYKLRSKEDAPDYRYMPDPNLGIVHVSENQIENVKASLPERPAELRERLTTTYSNQGVTEQDFNTLLAVDSTKEVSFDGEEPEEGVVAYYERIASGRDPKVVMNWLVNNVLGQLSKLDKPLSDRPPAHQVGELIDLVESGKVTRPSSKLLLKQLLTNPIDNDSMSVKQLAADMDLLSFSATPTTDSSASEGLDQICQRIVDSMPSEAAAVRAGNKNVINKMVGRVMKETKGRAGAQATREVLERFLS